MNEALVIGPGAIGLTAATALARQGLAPGFIGRGGPAPVQARFTDRGGERQVAFPAGNPARAVIAVVAVKAFDLEAALSWTAELAAGTPVVPLSNGAVEDIVRAAAARRPDLAWRLGYSTVGVSSPAAGSYVVRSETGELAFGPLAAGGALTTVEAKLAAAGDLWHWHSGILWLTRRKWLFNTVINTLCAARRLPRNGDLLGDLSTLSTAFEEALHLGTELWGPWPESRQALFEGVLKLIEATADNENSMARDRRLGRRTEAAFLAGMAADPRRYPLLAQLQAEASAHP